MLTRKQQKVYLRLKQEQHLRGEESFLINIKGSLACF